jgi:hypothetical protein
MTFAIYSALLALSASGSSYANLLGNSGFESTPVPASPGYVYRPTNDPNWSYSGSSGVLLSKGASAWYGSTPPANSSGSQYAFVQRETGVISQSFSVNAGDAGHYKAAWADAGRPAGSGVDGNETYTLKIDNSVKATQKVTSGQAFTQRTASFIVGDALANNAATYTLSFNGTTPGDHTAFIDNVDLELVDRYAKASVTPTPISLGGRRINTSADQALSIANTALNDGKSEKLNASFGAGANSNTTVHNNNGSVSGLAGGSSNNAAMTVGIDTSSAGHKAGTIAVTLESDGADFGFGKTSLGTQSVAVSGDVYRLATGNTATDVSLGNHHVGDVVTQNITVTNTAAADGFSEKLNANFGAPSSSDIKATGAISLLNASPIGDSASMAVGIDTTTAGAKSGTVAINYASDGTGTDGAAAISNGSQTINVSGKAYNYAKAEVDPTAKTDFNVRIGSSATQALTISNKADPGIFSEKLNAAFGTVTGTGVTTNGGAINLLKAGDSNNSSMSVGIDTSSAGAKSGTVAIDFKSDGESAGAVDNSGLGKSSLASQSVSVSGNVYRLATGDTATTVTFTGGHHVGESVQQKITVVNSAAADGFSEKLNASFGTPSSSDIKASGVINLLNTGPGGDSSSMVVGIDTSVAGTKTGMVTINYASDGTGTDGAAAISNGSQTITVNGKIYNYADADFIKSSSSAGVVFSGDSTANKDTDGLVYTVDFGARTDNTGIYSIDLSLLNNVTNAGFTDYITDGSFILSGLGSFGDKGFSSYDFEGKVISSFHDLTAGNAINGLMLTFDTNTLGVGHYTGAIQFKWKGKNDDGYLASAFETITLNIDGTINAAQPSNNHSVPEPSSLWLLSIAGLGMISFAWRRNNLF